MEPKSKILVGVLNQGYIRPELAEKLTLMEKDERFDVTICHSSLKPSENNRNFLVKKALEEGYDFLLTIDHDTIPLNNPLDFAKMELDVVGGAYPQWNMSDKNYPLYFISMDKVEGGYKEHKNRDGLQEVDAVGSGCMMLSRKVMEAVKEPFVRKFEDGFAVTGLDFYFCEKAKDLGFKVYCHYDYVCSHFKEVDLLAVYNFKENGR